MNAIELRIGELLHYVITMIDEHCNYALALAVQSLNSDIVWHFFCRAARLFPVSITRSSLTTGKSFWGNSTKRCRKLPSGTYGLIPIRRK